MVEYNNNIAITGRLTADPELHYSQNSNPYSKFSIAYNHYKKDQEDEVSFFNVIAFGVLAENVANSLEKGDRVNVVGSIKQNRWETDSGEKRSTVSIVADEVAPSLRWVTITEIEPNEKPQQQKQQPSRGRQSNTRSRPSRGRKVEPF